jgi:glycerol uptake facilitator-like aquaporin
MHGPLVGEFTGTMVLVLLGDGVVAKSSKKIALILPILPNGAHDGLSPHEALMNA